MLFSGSYGIWAYDQPNDYGGYQDCAALGSSENSYDLMDEACTYQHPYICDIRMYFTLEPIPF